MLKRTLLNIVNVPLRPLGLQLYRNGLDMESVLARMPPGAREVATVFDIGASNGRWSRLAMPHFPKARFIAIDPLVEREPELKRLKAREARFDYVLSVAGEEANGEVSIAVGEDPDTSTVGGHEGAARKVKSHSIDELRRVKSTQGPYLLKFDTHGYEVPILRGATETLHETRYIVMEVYNFRHTRDTLLFAEMCSLLDGMDFRCFNMVDPLQRPGDGSLWQMDFFFARKDDSVFACETFRTL
jgi:FkbM family methyltransferase